MHPFILGLALLAFGSAGCGGEGPVQVPPSQLEKKAARVERWLARRPGDVRLLRATMKAWIGAGNDQLHMVNTGNRPIPATVSEDFRTGLQAWTRYLQRMGGEAGYEIAELAGGTYFSLLEIGSRDVGEVESNAANAARALRIAGRHRHNLFTLSNVAVYAYFNGEYAAGDRAAKGAAADVARSGRRIVIEQLDAYREKGEAFQGQLKRAAAQLRKSGEKELDRPLRAYASAAGINRRE